MKDDRVYLFHIRDGLDRIERYLKKGKDNFFADTMVQDAVIRNLQTMAESSRYLSDSIKKSYPEADWKNISGFRNVLVHDYLGLDLNQIWDIVEKDLPPLRKIIDKMIKKLK